MLCRQRKTRISVCRAVEHITARFQKRIQIRDDIGVVFNDQNAHGVSDDGSPVVFDFCLRLENYSTSQFAEQLLKGSMEYCCYDCIIVAHIVTFLEKSPA